MCKSSYINKFKACWLVLVTVVLLSPIKASAALNYSVEYRVLSQWNSGSMASVIIQNTGDEILTDWQVDWSWAGDQRITHSWNADVTQTDAHVVALCKEHFCTVKPGESQAFGFNLSYTGTNEAPLKINIILPSAQTEPEPAIEPELPIEPVDSTEPSLPNHHCVLASEPNVEYAVNSTWGNGGMSTVVVRNHTDTVVSDWSVNWSWPEDHKLSNTWNASVSQTGTQITADCTNDFCQINPGEAKSFGFVFSFNDKNATPTNLTLISTNCQGDIDPNTSTDTTPSIEPTPPATPTSDNLNYVLGTQSIGPKYSFTNDPVLVETAKAIREMGSNLLKIALSPTLYSDLSDYRSYEYQFKLMLEKVPAFKQVLDMDFAYYMLWVEDSGAWLDNNGMSQDELDLQYQKIYELTEYLLTHYNDSGKTFMLGHWEGDWQYVNLNGNYDDSIETLPELRTQGLIDWINIRQKAIEDAKANITHSSVEVLQYVEVNRVASAMSGKDRITNKVLPHVNVDLVSYSAYDIVNSHDNYNDMSLYLTEALDYIEDNLKPKAGVPFDKRVFLGEYGYASYWFSSWGDQAGKVQNDLSKNVIKVALEWGTPFILYWQMYDNEYDSWAEAYKGFWLIDDKGVKQPIYYTHQNFYTAAQVWADQFEAEQGRKPSETEFRIKAIELLDESASQTIDPTTGNTSASGASSTTGTDCTGTNCELDQIGLWFFGDSITYGLTTLPYNAQGFRAQIWQDMVNAADGASPFPFTITKPDGLMTINYSTSALKAIGTVSGPSAEGYASHNSKNYWHSGIPGATTNDMLCFLDPSSAMAEGYRFNNCQESLNAFNDVPSGSCQASIVSGGWLNNPNCYLNQEITTNQSIIVPLQLGTNDITFLNASGALNCSLPPQAGDTTATRLKAVVTGIISPQNHKDESTLVGKLHRYLNDKGITDERIAFVISMIPKRTNSDGQDPLNYCTDYFNSLIKDNVIGLGEASHIFLANQGNVVPEADSVHPTTEGHATMACNLLYGYSNPLLVNRNCPIPNIMPEQGLLKALQSVTQ